MRHSRSSEFERELGALDQDRPIGWRWTDGAADPNDPAVLVRRADDLRRAWRPQITDRIVFLEERCRGRRVLDIGCVAHDTSRIASGGWLHARLADAASECVGVDVLADGVREMRDHGYEAVVHDLRQGLGPLAEQAPFDVIVAGELIEHVEALDMLFITAREALSDDGEMIITTPNPYAPHRVRAARLGIIWENVDHILYAFPSGMAELCDRHGLVLREAATTADRAPRGLNQYLKSVKRRLKGRQWLSVGYATVGRRRVRRVGQPAAGRFIRKLLPGERRFDGETFIYVVRRA